jgi:DNA-binding transcriptional LysR family regulator
MFSLVDKTEVEFKALEEVNSGDIYIGAPESASMGLFAEIVCRLQKEYPKIRCNIYSGNVQDVCEKLDKGLLDFAIVMNYVDLMKYNSLPMSTKDNWGVVMRQDDPLVMLDKVHAGDLLDHSLITPPQGFSRALRHWAGSERANLERQIVCNHWLPLNAKHLVSAGIGVMLTYGGLIGEEGSSDGLCFRPLSPRVEATHKVLWRKVMPTKPMQAFIDELTLLCE